MSRRRMDKLEDSLAPKQAVRLWLAQAHGAGSLPAYADSLIDQPEAAQPFIAIPARVQEAASVSMRRDRSGLLKEVGREARGDTVFLMRLVIGLNVHVEQMLRIERLRHAALMWWSRALDARSGPKPDERSDWHRGVSTLRGGLLGTERARITAEATYLDGHDCLFPELAAKWWELCAVADRTARARPLQRARRRSRVRTGARPWDDPAGSHREDHGCDEDPFGGRSRGIAMKGDRVEILVDAGTGSVERFEISATKAGRRIEITTGRGVVEVAEMTRTGRPVRSGRFMASRVVALVEHPALEGAGGVDETTQRRLGGDAGSG